MPVASILIFSLLLLTGEELKPTESQTKLSSLPKECASAEVIEHNVTDAIFSRYSSLGRPVRNVSDTININITLSLSGINDVVEKLGTLKLAGYLSVRWMDQLRVWNDKFPLNCVTYIVISARRVWLPDIALMNADARYEPIMDIAGEKVRVYSDGYTTYSPGGTFVVYCDYDLTLFPFDTQDCSINFESWRYTHPFMTFSFLQQTVKIYQWIEHEQWELVNTSQQLFGVSYMDPENTFDRVEFYLRIKRKSRYYLVAIIAPGSMILIAQLSVFALPLEEVQKLCILFTCLLAYFVFMLMIVGDVPRSSDKIPLLSFYVDASMTLISFSILGECIVFALLRHSRTHHRHGPGFAPPWLAKTAIIIAKILHIRPYILDDHLNRTIKPKITSEPMSDDIDSQPPAGVKLKTKTTIETGTSGYTKKQKFRVIEISGKVKCGFEMFDDENKATSLSGNTESNKATVNNKSQVANGVVTASKEHQTTPAKLSTGDDENKNSVSVQPASEPTAQEIAAARLQWYFIANVVDRLTLYCYTLCIVLVPVIMFVITPANAKA